MREPVLKPQRCAIDTRKSTEHNLDLGSIGAVVKALDAKGARTRKGHRFGVGPTAQILSNRRRSSWRSAGRGAAPANLTVTSLTAALPHEWGAQERRFLAV